MITNTDLRERRVHVQGASLKARRGRNLPALPFPTPGDPQHASPALDGRARSERTARTALCQAPFGGEGRQQKEIMPERELWRVIRTWESSLARSWRVSGLSGSGHAR